jgi:hypothetical protein
LEIRLEIDAWLMIAKPFKNNIRKKHQIMSQGIKMRKISKK